MSKVSIRSFPWHIEKTSRIKLYLAVGLGGGIMQKSLAGDKLKPLETGDQNSKLPIIRYCSGFKFWIVLYNAKSLEI
jgi:hypothetical protein